MTIKLKLEGFFPIKINENIKAFGRQDLNDDNMYEIGQLTVISSDITYESIAVPERDIKITGDVMKCVITDRGYGPGTFFSYITIHNEQVNNNP